MEPETPAPIRIVRAPKDPAHPYARLGNTVLTPGPTLPLDSRSVLVYLLSLPDRWHLRMSHLRRVIGCGRDKLQRMIRDLEAAGHLVRRRIHAADGRWWWDSTLYEEPVAAVPTPPVSPLPPDPAPVAAVPPAPAIQQRTNRATTYCNKGDESNPPATPIQEPAKPPYSPYIAAVVLDHSRELGNGDCAPANITQALRLAAAAGLPEAAFVDHLHTARQRVRLYQGKQGAGQLAHKMAYYFVVLRDLCGLTDAPKCRN